MATDLLDRLQADKLRTMNQFVEEVARDVASQERDRLTAAIVEEGLALRQALTRFWDYYWTAALQGKVSERRQEGEKLRSLLEQGAASLARAAAVARQGAAEGQELARLVLLEEQSQAFPRWIEECLARWELLDRPRQALNRERTARARAAFARGECEAATDILARLHQGGPLVQE
ncbi:MAG: hypothetical protein JNM56_05785 [Planctomycetia bacterium]|nr:hypothetical protein [Planctomycetia bacterium]